METTKPRRRKGSKPKVENYYKVLGLRSNCRHERIKENYIQLVKQYPPEQHPEEFQKIRQAYDMLRDPVKRKEYDLVRKYGGSIEKMMEESSDCMYQENWNKAETLFTDVLKMNPNTIGAQLGLAQIQLLKNELDEFEIHMQVVLDNAESAEDQATILALKAKLLLEEEHPEKALAALDVLNDQYSDYANSYRVLQIHIYRVLGREEDAFKLIESEIPSLEAQEPDQIMIFIIWINAMMELEKWQLSDKIQQRTRKFLKSIKVDDDRIAVASALVLEYESYFEAGMIREAALYMELLYSLDSKHPVVLDQRRDVQELSRVNKEMERIAGDDDLFPLVSMQAMEWFYEEFSEIDRASEYKQMLPPGFLQKMELLNEEFAAGIQRLKRKYPITYRRYQDEWDNLFEMKVSGLSREVRRRLK